MELSESIVAVACALFLVVVCIASFWYLQTAGIRALPKPPSTPSSAPRTLTEEQRKALERKLEREAARLNLELEQRRQKEARETAKPSFYEDKLRKREQERISKAQELEEEERTRDADLNAQYKNWKNKLSVVEVSEQDDTINPRYRSLDEFISHLIKAKRCDVQSLASIFQLSIDQVVSRILELENQGKIYGIFDDQGRYLVLSKLEMGEIKNIVWALDERVSLNEIHSHISKLVTKGSL